MGFINIDLNGINGGAGSDAVTYSIGKVAAGDVIGSAKWVEIAGVVNSERNRRQGGNTYVDTGRFGAGTNIEASDINNMVDALQTAPYPYTAGFGGVSAGNTIYASNINELIDKVVNAGAVCVCNCNYCTCNCNYCTCNCNYSCTCNCNYSDERLKDNIELVGHVDGVNVYSFVYKWERNKKYRGVIAQDLIGTKYEAALNQDAAGYYYVDYSILPIEFTEG